MTLKLSKQCVLLITFNIVLIINACYTNVSDLSVNASDCEFSSDDYRTESDKSVVSDAKDIDKFVDDLIRLRRAIDKVNNETSSTTSHNSLDDNFTHLESCVGNPEYCNLTYDEYMALLHEAIYPQPLEWILIMVHGVVFVIGLLGNALVCVAVYRNHSMRTVTNYFIVNLAVADFMVILFCLPPTVLWDVTKTWFLGNALCRILLYFQSVSVTVSVLTLTFISMDRWYAICFPLKFKSTTSRAKTAIVIIWLISLLFNIPELVVLSVQRKEDLRFNAPYFMQCAPTWSTESDTNWHIIQALVLYTIPLFLMMIAYCQIVRVLWRSDNIPGHNEQTHKYSPANQNNCSNPQQRRSGGHPNAPMEGQLRSRRKAAKMLVAVVVMFAVCYFPVHLMSVLRLASGIETSDAMSFLALLSHVMCYANSAINPLIYNFMSGKFRREFHRSFLCWCFGRPSPEHNGNLFPLRGCSRADTTRTLIRRNDSCASYRLTHLSPSNRTTSFIENNNRATRRTDSLSENLTRLTLTTDVCKD